MLSNDFMWLFYPKPCISVAARKLLTLSLRLGWPLPSACREINVYKWNSAERQSHTGFIKNPLQNVLVLYPAEQQNSVYTSWLQWREQHPAHFKCVKCTEEDHQVLPLYLGAVRRALLLSNNPKGWDAASLQPSQKTLERALQRSLGLCLRTVYPEGILWRET